MTTDVHHDRLTVLGGGNMGAALVTGMLAAASFDAASLAIVEPLTARREELAAMFPGVSVTGEVPPCDGAVIAVKPHDVPAAVAAAVRAGAHRVLSIAAGITTASLAAAAADAAPDRSIAVVRSMPNTPAFVGQGMAAVAGGDGAGDDDLAWAERILGSVGRCVRVDESMFDAVTALTGSGPAYVFFLAEALTAAGIDAGLPADLVDVMVAQLLVGSSALLAERGDPGALRAMVTSPNGTTAAGVARLEAHDVAGAVLDAVRAAAARSRELGA